MRQIYIKHLRRAYSTSGDEYLEDEKVAAGKVLDAHRVSAWFDNIAATEAIRWYLKVGHEYLWLGDDKPGTASGPAQRDLETHLGEGMILGCYAPDIASNEVLHFVITGCLWDIEDWRSIVGY